MTMRIFWSWQNDLSTKHNRFFVRDVLAKTISDLNLKLDEAERLTLDHDTKDEPGLVNISETIFKKIAKSAVFVADVTPTAKSESEKAVPNPNVLIEMGWALKCLSEKRIIAILNTAYGWKIEDLPFHLRGKRILPYSLSEDADKAATEKTQQKLSQDLKQAISINLKDHSRDIADSNEVLGVDKSPSNPSYWAGASERISHQDPDKPGRGVWIQLRGVSGYIRVIPNGWRDRKPSVADIGKLPDHEALWPPAKLAQYRGHGPTDRGYVRYHFERLPVGQRVQRTAIDLAYFLEDTGEFWVRLGNIVDASSGAQMLDRHSLLKGWSEVIRKSFDLFDQFNADRLRRVEVGLVGMRSVHWPAEHLDQSPVARKNEFIFGEQHRSWDNQAELDFLTRAYARLHDLFGLPEPDHSEVKDDLKFLIPAYQ